ncbi:EKC/KEOPS complex subunit [Cyphellophora attinorum]|uniref:EKC/KEOPS complex subunit CGI121 n=1 Tax=Cyphellophora attinorum TaxID=1664694 RepID=A0A0N1HTS3_9EURO|nr:EKC/KEOPS complex subunit [Phialophora attinorum]KPI42543.1 EKC/KEOPS complex subunit [Phialophora attinorum]
MVERVYLPHVPEELAVYVAYYRNVSNAAFLREQLLAGNHDFEYAFIDASMVISRRQIFAATFRAINDLLHDRLKSRNVHSEIVFCLSSNNNIGEAFRRFGVGDATKNLIVVKVAEAADLTQDQVAEHLSANVKGEEVVFREEALEGISDIARIRKIYKLPAPSASKATNGVHPSASDLEHLEAQILGAMALRGAT